MRDKRTNNRPVKKELLSRWNLEAEFRNISQHAKETVNTGMSRKIYRQVKWLEGDKCVLSCETWRR